MIVIHFDESLHSINFPVTKLIGNSVPTSHSGRQRLHHWKVEVAAAAKKYRGRTPWNPEWQYAISIGFAFHLGSHGYQRLDVENFIKPCIDALAAGLFCAEEVNPASIEHWNYDDSNFNWLFIQRLDDVLSSIKEGAAVSASAIRPKRG